MSTNDPRRQEAQDVEPEPISPELEGMANDLIDICLDELAERGSLLTTLCVENARGDRVTLTFDDIAVEECIEKARDTVAAARRKADVIDGLRGKPVRYAIAYDGAIREREGGPYLNALIVEYGEVGLSSAYSAYLLYKKAGHPKDFVCSDPTAAGEMPLLV